MPVFTYRGTNRSGGNVSGEVNARDKAAEPRENLLRRQQITPTKMSRVARNSTCRPSALAVSGPRNWRSSTRQFSADD